MSSADIPESGGASMDDGESPAFDTSVAHQARVYDYLLGGKDNYAADRAYAEAAIVAYPGAVATARVNRAFLGRAVRYLATEARISQFLDIGTGIPSSGSTHQVAQAVEPGSRIVYVDNDPVVLAHARALLVSGEHGATDYIDADLRKPEVILDRAVRTLDFTRPVGVLLLAILHAIGDEDDPHRIVAKLMDTVPRGSYLVISHMGSDLLSPDEEAGLRQVNREKSHHQYSYRTKAEIARFLDGLQLVEPGMVRAEDWRPDPRQETAGTASLWAAVARKP